MKTKLLIAILAVGGIFPIAVYGQSNFTPESFKAFIESNKNLSTQELLNQNPPKTTYYATRKYPTSAATIPWFDSLNSHYNYTSDEKALLAQNHFMVTERLKSQSYLSSYVDVYMKDMPVFISSDFVLHTLHRSYDEILKYTEYTLLEKNLDTLLAAMYKKIPYLQQQYGNHKGMNKSIYDIDLFISVAYSLLNDTAIYPHYVAKTKLDTVLKLVESEQLVTGTIFTDVIQRKYDFSQFKPRGHYTDEIWTPNGYRTLENYFRAMMWMGRMDFLLTPPPEYVDDTEALEDIRRAQIDAVLMNILLEKCGRKDLLETHEKIITYMVGPDDNLSPAELYGLMAEIGNDPLALFNNDTFKDFTDTLNASDDYGQKIMSNFFTVDMENTAGPVQLPISYRLLGQKFLIDSYITAQLVYDRIQWNNKDIFRPMPDPLDVMGVLGNEDALALMKDEMEQYHYAYKVNEIKYLINAYDDDFWSQSLYNTWLNGIRKLNPPSTSNNLPYFMQTTAWRHQKLNTQLTSWAELRHDNLLYGKQSYTGGTSCSFPYTYIEPQPQLYTQIQKFAEQASVFFEEVYAGADEGYNNIAGFWDKYAGHLENFAAISKKQLNKQKLNTDDLTYLKTMINHYMASGPSISGWVNELYFTSTSTEFENDFICADIHTQPTDKAGNVVGRVYHVGTGELNYAVVFAPNPVNPSQLMAFTGPVGAFHYDITNNFYRYNDIEWANKFHDTAVAPARPDWTALYLANGNGKKTTVTRALNGEVYQFSNTTPQFKLNKLDYVLAFPNPVQQQLNIRFIINQPMEVSYQLHDYSGKLHRLGAPVKMLAAEHNLTVNVADLSSGNYILTFKAGNTTKTIKVQID